MEEPAFRPAFDDNQVEEPAFRPAFDDNQVEEPAFRPALDDNQVEEPAFRPAFDGNQERALAPVAWDRVRIVRLPTNADSPLVSAPDQRAPDSFECIRDAAQNPHRPEFDDS